MTQYLIPEEFPFDERITASASPLLANEYLLVESRCRPLGVARWAPACLKHDTCMEAIGLYGASSEQCHSEMQAGWQAACTGKYGFTQEELESLRGMGSIPNQMKLLDKGFCLEECKKMAVVATDIMRMAASSFPAAGKHIVDIDGNGIDDAVLFPKKDLMYIDRDQRRQAVPFHPPIPVWPAEYYKAGDFNGDGHGDLVMIVQGTDYVHPFWGTAQGDFEVGHFNPWPAYGIGSPISYHVGDFNRDYIDDLIHFVPGSDYVHVWLGTRNKTFNLTYFRPSDGYTVDGSRVKVGDFDGDGFKDDLVDILPAVGNLWRGAAMLWRGNDDATFSVGSFRPWQGYDVGTASEYRVVDFGGNGVDDLYHVPHRWKWQGQSNFQAAGFTVAPLDWADVLLVW
jgi:hypothetical protein